MRIVTRMLIAGAILFCTASLEANDQKTGGEIPNAEAVEDAKFFERDVLPILQAKCFRCHGGGEEIRGGLNLTDRKAILAGGDSGFTIDTEHLEESLLISAVQYGDLQMPPTGKMAPAQIATIERWVKAGLPWKADGKPIEVESEDHGPPQINEKTRKHYAFQPVQRPAVPDVKGVGEQVSPVDAFILRGLDARELTLSEPASKTEWLRRATYDITGLPPTPEEVQAFLQDESSTAYEAVVDRLLSSPHYGEKWGRFWLDLVRYGESNSFERDNPKPFVWRYRDYVIRSFNNDKPYDQFIREQLAGDELEEVTPETITATGYYRLGIWDDEPADPKLALYDEIDDIVSTTGQVFLGLTINCARCHDHKLDPIPQADYYRFVSFFRNIRRYGARSDESIKEASLVPIQTEEQRLQHADLIRKHNEKITAVEKQMAAIEAIVIPDFIPVEKEEFRYDGRRVDLLKKRVPKLLKPKQFQEYRELRKKRDQLRRSPPQALAVALAVKEHGRTAPPTHILMRGNPHAEGDVVEPGFPQILDPPAAKIPSPAEDATSTNRRLALANWIASNENPLTARVMVNRIWQGHFGRGLVRSPSNLGLTGDKPTHPELLDWLAAEFMSNGWRMKPIHREILLSRAYRQSSRSREAAYAADPENNLFWRFNPRRLNAEEIRDSILAVNGSLNQQEMFGPSIYTELPQEVLATQSRPGANWGRSSEEDRNRRTIYIHVKRSLVIPVMANFDGPESDLTCPVRFATTQPTQALNLLNSDFMQKEARKFADDLRKASTDPGQQVKIALTRSLQRTPTEAEQNRGVKFLSDMQEKHELSADQALDFYCLLALNLNEFMYLD